MTDGNSDSSAKRIAIGGLIVAVFSLIVSVKAIRESRSIAERQRQWKLADRETDRTPKLSFVSKQHDQGVTYVTVQNKTGTGTAVIDYLRFVIDDKSLLSDIEVVLPRNQHPMAGSAIPTDTVYFTEGHWNEDGSYSFGKEVQLQVKPGDPNRLALAIVNERWKGFLFHGTVIVSYGDDQIHVKDVEIVGQSAEGRNCDPPDYQPF